MKDESLIMLDPSKMYPESFRPVVTDRSKDFKDTSESPPTRYLLLDFGPRPPACPLV